MVVIILDGMDRAGKTTVGKMLAKRNGFEYIKFPTSRKLFSEVLNGSVEPYPSLLLFAHDIIKTLMNLDPEKDYIFDRSFISTMLYQGTELSVKYNIEYGRVIDKIYRTYFPPEFPYYTELPPMRAFLLYESIDEFKRRNSENIDTFETVEFQKNIKNAIPIVSEYLNHIAVPKIPTTTIDTTNMSPEEVYDLILAEIKGIGVTTPNILVKWGVQCEEH